MHAQWTTPSEFAPCDYVGHFESVLAAYSPSRRQGLSWQMEARFSTYITYSSDVWYGESH